MVTRGSELFLSFGVMGGFMQVGLLRLQQRIVV